MKRIFFFFFLIVATRVGAQEMKINWSETITYDHLTTGYFEEFIGDHGNQIYSLWTDGSDFDNFYKGVKIVGLDKNSLTISNEFIISGFGGGLGDENEAEYYHLKKLMVRENEFAIFFSYERDEVVTYFLQRLDMQLHPIGEPVQFFQFNREDHKGEIDAFPKLVFGRPEMSLFAIAHQLNAYGEPSKVKMKFFDFTGSLQEEKWVDVPVQSEKGKKQSWFWFTLFSDDYYKIGYTKIETYRDQKGKEEEKVKSYSLLVNRTTGETQPLDYSEGNVEFQNTQIHIEQNILEMVGIYASTKEAGGEEIPEGFFRRVIDLGNSKILKDDRLSFDENFLKEMRPANGKPVKNSKEDPLTNLRIVSMEKNGNDWMVLGTSFRYWSARSCDSRGNCWDTDYEEERGFYLFELSQDFSSLTSSVLHRYNIYVNKPSRDLSLVKLRDGRFMIGLDVHKKTTSSFDKKSKYMSLEERKEMWTYAIYDREAGLSYQSTRINQPDTDEERSYKINPEGIYQTEAGIFCISDARDEAPNKLIGADVSYYDRFKRKPPYTGGFSWGKIEQ